MRGPKRPAVILRGAGDTIIGDSWSIAQMLYRHRAQVARICVPIACDMRSRIFLYDLDAAEDALRDTPRRNRDLTPA